MAQYFTFKYSALPTVEEVGGKGFSLIYSANKGFPFPMAVVLSTFINIMSGTNNGIVKRKL